MRGAPTDGGYSQISAGSLHACTLTSDGYIEGWGDDDHGQTSGAPTSGGYSQISAGGGHACALTSPSGHIEYWGYPYYGKVSEAPTNEEEAASTAAVFIAADGGYSQVSAGAAHACAISSGDGRIECWDSDDSGQVSEAPTG